MLRSILAPKARLTSWSASAVPSGLIIPHRQVPTLKRWAIFALSLPGQYVFSVAQIFNLLYRRFVIGKAWKQFEASRIAASPQNAILRYGRLKICATTLKRVTGTELQWATDCQKTLHFLVTSGYGARKEDSKAKRPKTNKNQKRKAEK